MYHPALSAGSTAVITGGAAGIGLATAIKFASFGMRVCIADLGAEKLAAARQHILHHTPGGGKDILAVEADVSRDEDLKRLHQIVLDTFGSVDVLMNNAGIRPDSSVLSVAHWREVMDVNLWGVIRGTQTFVPGMLSKGKPGLVINTGSKQGVTAPPGNPAYNVSKAALKVFTESLQHELRNTAGCQITAHLFMPGYVFTELVAGGAKEKPAGAWSAEQTVDFMLDSLKKGDFYILCPDNEVSRSLDELRILWAAGDIVENRPPLSRWHSDHASAFEASLHNR